MYFRTFFVAWYSLHDIMTPEPAKQTIVIAGAGFAGVRAALDLDRLLGGAARIILLSDRPHFEYYAALYKIVAGASPLEVCVPLREIFNGTGVEVVEDAVAGADLALKMIIGCSGSRYRFDKAVLAFGSEPAFFDIPGLAELSYPLFSINDALRLARHIHTDLLSVDTGADVSLERGHIVVVGAGPAGVEIAGELASTIKDAAKHHGREALPITIDLIEASPRVLPMLKENISRKAEGRLRKLGVNMYTSRTVVEEEVDTVYLKDMRMRTKTVIWTAGARPNALYKTIEGLALDPKGRVQVDEHLRAHGHADVYIAGDGASTKFTGRAPTAILDGSFIANDIVGRNAAYIPKPQPFAIPIGRRFALVSVGPFLFSGRLGFWIRRLIDLRFFLSILSPAAAVTAWSSGTAFSGQCDVCSNTSSGTPLPL
jgi:NADH:ubiquinone reductase (H+-translocating)